MRKSPLIGKCWTIGIILLFVEISVITTISGLSIEKVTTKIQINSYRDDNDTTPPVTTITTDPEPTSDGWYPVPVWVTLNATDNESGVNATYYQINNEGWETYIDAFWLTMEGFFVVQFYSVDNAGNEEIPKQVEIKIDNTPPIIYYFLDPPVPNGLNGWYVSDVWLTLNATDYESGVWRIYCNGQIYTEPVLITGDGSHSVKVYAIDNVGNVNPAMTIPPICIDETAPFIAMNYTWEQIGINQYNIIITVIANDAMSGMQRVEWYWNDALVNIIIGPGPNFGYNYTWTPGGPKYTIKAIAYDMAGLSASAELINPHSIQSQSQLIRSLMLHHQIMNLFLELKEIQ